MHSLLCHYQHVCSGLTALAITEMKRKLETAIACAQVAPGQAWPCRALVECISKYIKTHSYVHSTVTLYLPSSPIWFSHMADGSVNDCTGDDLDSCRGVFPNKDHAGLCGRCQMLKDNESNPYKITQIMVCLL